MLQILKGCFLYILLDTCLEKVGKSFLNSAIFRFFAFLLSKGRAHIGGSAIARFFTRIADAVGAGMRNSLIIGRILKEDEAGRFKERGFVFRIYLAVLGLLRKVYRLLRLDRLMENSIFLRPWIWAISAMVLLPLLPTMAVLGLVMVSAFSLMAAMLHDESRTLHYSAVNKYVWLYMLAYGLATLTSVTVRGSLPVGLITIGFILFYHVLVSGIETKRQLRFLIGALAAVGAIVSLYGIYQFIFPSHRATAWLDEGMFDFVRVYSTLGNPNVLGKYFLLVIPLAFAAVILSRSRVERFLLLAAAGLMCICLVLTYSRGAYLGILFAAAIFLALLDRRFILPGILLAGLIFLLMPEAILQRFVSIGDMEDTSTSFRVFIWMGTLAMLQDYWFSGIGPGEAAWDMVYPAYSFHAIGTPHSHNLFLQITSDAGAPGLFLFLAVLYQYFKTTFAAIRRKIQGEQRILVIASIAAVVGFLVQSMTDYTFYNYRVMLFFWCVLAVGVIAVRYDTLGEGGRAS